jgi:hypothetical protein
MVRDTREFKILRIDMTIYRDRKVIELIGGTGKRVTFNDTSTKYFCNFHLNILIPTFDILNRCMKGG